MSRRNEIQSRLAAIAREMSAGAMFSRSRLAELEQERAELEKELMNQPYEKGQFSAVVEGLKELGRLQD